MATGRDQMWTWKKPPPPSVAILRNIFMNTTDLNELCHGLFIPDDKRDVDSAVEYYARSTHPVKMRKMIFQLDLIGDTALAESVMDYAEPPADPSFNPLLLTPVFQAITGDVEEIVPDARVGCFREKFSDPGQVNAEAGKYCALYHPIPTWRGLAGDLYTAGETKAAQMARHHVHVVTDPSLNPANILRVTHNVPLWRSRESYNCLDMPKSQHNEIVRKFDDEEPAKKGLITEWLAGHPCPTWENVRKLLIHAVGGEEGKRAADEVEETYIKTVKRIFRHFTRAVTSIFTWNSEQTSEREETDRTQNQVASGSDQASAVPSTATTSEYPTSHPPSSQYSSSRLMSGEAVEIRALTRNLSHITAAVTVGGTPQWFADHLVEQGFIARDTAQGILGTHGITPAQQAGQLLDSVFAQINGSDRKRQWFNKLTEIFSQDRAHTQLAERLQLSIQELREDADMFQSKERRVRHKLWWQSVKLWIILISIIVVILALII